MDTFTCYSNMIVLQPQELETYGEKAAVKISTDREMLDLLIGVHRQLIDIEYPVMPLAIEIKQVNKRYDHYLEATVTYSSENE